MKEKKLNEEKGKRSPKKILITIGFVFILILATISFVFIPGMIQDSSNELPAFGYYDGKPIEYKQGSYFASAIQYFMDQASAQNKNLSITDEYYIFNNAFATTVANMAYTTAVKDSGYIVPDSLLNRTMKMYFVDENGKFSQRLFNETSDTTKVELRNSILDSLEYNRYDNDLFGSQSDVMGDYTMYGLKTSSKEYPFITKMGEKQRSFEYVTFNMIDYPKSEAVIWGKEHPELFTKYDLSVISVESKAEADKLYKQLQNNEILFEDAVAEYSKKYYSNEQGKLSNTYSYDYQIKGLVKDEESVAAVTGLTEGVMSNVIATQNGFSIFKADSNPVAADFDNETIVDAVANYMSIYESGIIETYFINISRDFANFAAYSDFASACAEYNLTPEKITASPLNYGDNPLLQALGTTNEALSSAATNKDFLKTAFSMQAEEISTPIVLGKNIVVMKLIAEEDVQGNDMMYQYYTTSFDRASVSTAIMDSDKLENNVQEVFFKYAFNN